MVWRISSSCERRVLEVGAFDFRPETLPRREQVDRSNVGGGAMATWWIVLTKSELVNLASIDKNMC